MRYLLFCVLCAFLVSNINADENKNLYITKVKVAETKANGKAWDLGKNPPDVQIKIFMQVIEEKEGKEAKEVWKVVASSKTFKDTLDVEKPFSESVAISRNEKYKIVIVDEDLTSPDMVGSHEFVVNEEEWDTCQEATISFESVVEFTYFISTQSTWEDAEKELKENSEDSSESEKDS